MKKTYVRLTALLLVTALLLCGCSSGNYDTKGQLSIGISRDLPLYSYDNMAADYAVIPADCELNDKQYKQLASAVLINDTTKEALVVHNAHQKIYPASMTKLMTGLLVFESLERGDFSLDETVKLKNTVTFNESNVGTSDLTGGCSATIKNLLYGLLIRSYNDCAVILARKVAGSEEDFVALMNKRAAELGATNTHFENCHGLHSDNHYTTAYDLYLIFSEFIKHDLAYAIDSLSSYDFQYTDAEGQEQSVTMVSTNGFLSGEYNLPEGYSIGSWKSGTTTDAGNCLIMEFVKEDTGDKYIGIIANAETREDLYHDMTSLVKLAQ